MQNLIQQMTRENQSVLDIWFDLLISHHPPPPPDDLIIKNLASNEKLSLKVADVFLGWLGEEEVIYIGEGEDVPVVNDCEDRRLYVPELGYDVPVVSGCPLNKEKLKEEELE